MFLAPACSRGFLHVLAVIQQLVGTLPACDLRKLPEHLWGAASSLQRRLWITGAGCNHPSGVQKHEAWFVVGRVQEGSLLAWLSAPSSPAFLSLMSLLSLSSWIHLPAVFCHFSSSSITTKCQQRAQLP